jgi:hypothetical protein
MRDNIKIERSKSGYFATIDGKAITEPLPKSKIHEAIEVYLEADKNQDGATTVKEIKARLEELGVEYPAKAKKSELAKLLTEAELESEEDDDSDIDSSDEEDSNIPEDEENDNA